MEAGAGLAVPVPVSVTSMTMNKKQVYANQHSAASQLFAANRRKNSRWARRKQERDARRAGRKAARIAIKREEKNNDGD